MRTKKLWAAMVTAILAALTVPLASPASAQVSVDLCATTGSVTMPDTIVVTTWSYVVGNCTGSSGTATLPGPEIRIPEGDSLTINLFVDGAIGENVSLVVPTLPGAPDVTGVAGGGSTTYSWTAGQLAVGTHLYESGVNPGTQVPMGLYGAIVVESAASTAAVDPVLVLSELDVDLNNSADPNTFNRNDYAPEYFLINGQAAPDVPDVAAATGDTVHLRYVNAGSRDHSMALLGARQTVFAKEGRSVPVERDVVAELIPSGHTVDTEIVLTNEHADSTLVVYNRNGRLTNDLASGSTGGMQMNIVVGAPIPAATQFISLDCGPAGNATTCTTDIDIMRVDPAGLTVVFDGMMTMTNTQTAGQVNRDPVNAQIDGFAFISETEILVSFQRPMHRTVFGFGGGSGPFLIDDSDVLLFTATSLGAGTTVGTWSWYFDGSDVGLGMTSEDVDALDITASGELLISTIGVANTGGNTFQDEDISMFTFTGAPGAVTAGTFSLYFDGSEADGVNGSGLNLGGEDIDAFGIDEDEDSIQLSTVTLLRVGENNTPVSARDEDLARCSLNVGPNTCSAWELSFDGTPYLLASYDVKGAESSRLVVLP